MKIKMKMESTYDCVSRLKSRRMHSTFTLWLNLCVALVLIAMVGCGNPASPPEETLGAKQSDEMQTASIGSERLLTRLFWQDGTEISVHTADLFQDGNQYRLKKSKVEGFPELSPQQFSLVQMEVCRGRLFIGVRDTADGKDKSGWVEIATGVEEESHGDHSHWHYSTDAKVAALTLDENQGNPAHVYRYGNRIYIANDKKDGFTEIQPSLETSETATSKAKFFRGGGGHITLAAVADRIAYSTWIDRTGENAGRVDVIDLRSDSTEPRYSFNLPTGGIHGAGACGNRVFFAPANGVCWVDCDFDFAKNSESVNVEHLALGDDPGNDDYRTGAFESFKDYMLCIANSKSGKPALCIINGTAPAPKVTRVDCGDLEDGMKVSTVSASNIQKNRPFAFAFAEGDGNEKLLVFELDPNGDRSFDDATLFKTIPVGRSKLRGHSGHHSMTILENRKTAVVTNPGDGTLSIVDLETLEVVQTIEVGGEPTALIHFGATM